MERTSIELITGFTKTGKPQYQKYLAKPIITLFETIQGSKLGLKLNKAFKGADFKDLTEEEFNNLSVTGRIQKQARRIRKQHGCTNGSIRRSFGFHR